MKTFETEKGNIPDGATHYRDEDCSYKFAWITFKRGDLHLWNDDRWGLRVAASHFYTTVKPIPQTNIETPEEKEVLDSINSNLIKPREPSNPVITKVEWGGSGLPAVGVECEFKYKNSSQAHWRPCKVFAYSNDMGAVAAIWHWVDYKWKHATIDVSDYEFRKTETEAERVERERLEAAYDLYCHWCFAMKYPKFSFDQFNGSERDKDGMLAIVNKTNYRKESE